MRLWFYSMEHRGGLKEAVETVQQLSFEEFLGCLDFYHLYGYDERIHSWRYLLDDMESNYSIFPAWLLISKVPADKWRL